MKKTVAPKPLTHFEVASNKTPHVIGVRAYDINHAVRIVVARLYLNYSIDYVHKESTSFFEENELYIHYCRVGLNHPSNNLLDKTEMLSVFQYLY
jgi:hypothetical protein